MSDPPSPQTLNEYQHLLERLTEVSSMPDLVRGLEACQAHVEVIRNQPSSVPNILSQPTTSTLLSYTTSLRQDINRVSKEHVDNLSSLNYISRFTHSAITYLTSPAYHQELAQSVAGILRDDPSFRSTLASNQDPEEADDDESRKSRNTDLEVSPSLISQPHPLTIPQKCCHFVFHRLVHKEYKSAKYTNRSPLTTWPDTTPTGRATVDVGEGVVKEVWRPDWSDINVLVTLRLWNPLVDLFIQVIFLRLHP